MKIPIAFPKENLPQSRLRILAADAGGTKTHLVSYQYEEGKMTLIRDGKFLSADYDSFLAILEAFGWNNPKPDVLCIAFAGPVLNGRAQATNLDWNIDIEELSTQLDLKDIFLINDLEAHAYGLAGLEEKDLQTIHIGNPLLKGNAAIIAPGTGLGEAGLFWDGHAFHPFATEGGHTDFGPHDIIDGALFRELHKQYGHVSWERLASGQGIWNIYEFLKERKKSDQPNWLQERFKTTDKAAAVSLGARHGDPVCKEAMDLFFKYLANEAANLAVQFKTTGGLFIGGGVVPKNLELLDVPVFLEHFFDKGRLRAMLEQVPIYIILNDKTALIGAAYYGVYAINEDTSQSSIKEAIRL